jgi:GDP-4-dehydro-6-deoxy-D-mannose reductase
MNIVIAKPSNIVGPGFSNGVCSIFARKIVDMEKNDQINKVLEVNNLQVQRDFVDIRDVIKGYDILFQKGKAGELYDLSSGKSHSLEEVIRIMRTLTHVEFSVKTKGEQQNEKPIQIIPQKMRALGWEPIIPFSSSINDSLEFHRRNSNSPL